jgi:hypothetical protein
MTLIYARKLVGENRMYVHVCTSISSDYTYTHRQQNLSNQYSSHTILYIVCLFQFYCGLLDEDVKCLDYTAASGGLIEVLARQLPGSTEENYEKLQCPSSNGNN